MPIDDAAGVGTESDRSASAPRSASMVSVDKLPSRRTTRSRSWLRTLMEWAVDEQGQFLQGRAALGPAFLAMVLPVAANAIGMAIFGYSRTSLAYEVMTWVTLGFWAAAAAYLAAYCVMTLHRLCEAIWDLVRGRASKRRDWP